MRRASLWWWSKLSSGGTEAGDAAGGFGEGVGLFEGGLNALDNAELGDAVAGGDGLGLGGEVGEDDPELAAITGVDDTREGGDAADGEAGAVFYQSAVRTGELDGNASADGLGTAFVAGWGQRCGFGGEEIGCEVSEGAGVGVAGELGGGVKALHANRGEIAVVGHWVSGLWLSVA